MRLKETPSEYTAGVMIVTADPSEKALPSPPITPASYTSLRRSTRSTATPVTPVDIKPDIHETKVQLDDANGTPSRKRARVKAEPLTPIKRESDALEDTEGSRKKTPSSRKKPVIQLSLDKPHPTPPKWEEQYRLIEKMRAGIVAPVDDMGCERPRTSKDTDPKTLRFHMLISLMLSSQTKDPVTSAAVTNLHHTLPGGLTAETLASTSIPDVEACINKVGFWRRKAVYITEAAKKLMEREGDLKGEVPDTLDELCELKGVGPKMAFLALQCAWDINAGIGVDVHVHRITNRLRWHKPQTTTPEQTRLNLQSWLPSRLHKPINPLMVGFGQVICLPVGPRCDHCLLGPKLCPSYVRNVNASGRKEVSYTFTRDEAKAEVSSESGGLQRMDDEEDSKLALDALVSETVKEEVIEQLVQEPGIGEMQVLAILDEVDGSQDIGAPTEVP